MTRREYALRYFDEQKSGMDARIRNGIETYRKGNAEIRFVSKSKLPESITVHAEQLRHAFQFGANLFMLDEFETEEKNGLYRGKFPEAFNLATLPFYWNALEPQKGGFRFGTDSPRMYRRPNADLCLAYCREKGITPKAHCLNYDYFRPVWLSDVSVEAHKAALEDHFRILAERYADAIPSWEVTNETFNVTFAAHFLDPAYSRFYRERDFNSWSFLTADRYFPKNHLIINDHLDFGCMRSPHGEFFGERSPYYMEIERMLQNGVTHLDAIGFQFHCFFSPEAEEELAVTRYNPGHLFEVLDTYRKLGKKLQITEMTLSAFGGSPEDEEIQALLLENLYSVFFSHPAMEAVIYWNLADGYASGSSPGDMKAGENQYFGGLCRFDLSEKPAFTVLKKLVNDKWHTTLTVPAVNGTAAFRGFYGDYLLTVCADGKEIPVGFTLSEQGNNQLTVAL